MCSPMTCGYPRVKDAHAQVKSPYYRAEASHGAHIGDKATVVCQKGYHMVTNATSSRPQTIDHVGLVCNEDGIWVNPFPYSCYNASMLAKLELAQTASDDDWEEANFSLQSIIFALAILTASDS